MQNIRQVLDRFVAWAAAQPDIHAVALVGSHARDTARPDSDIDLVVIASQPERYLQDTRWTRQFGEPRDQRIENYGRLTSLRVWYHDGHEVEYGITDQSWAALPLDHGTAQVIADGMRLLFERKPLLSPHLPFHSN